MTIPLLPSFYDMKYTEDDGRLTTESLMYNDQMFQSLNKLIGYFNDGVTFPPKTTAEIVAIEPTVDVGTVWFNTNLSKLQLKTAAGIIETIQSV